MLTKIYDENLFFAARAAYYEAIRSKAKDSEHVRVGALKMLDRSMTDPEDLKTEDEKPNYTALKSGIDALEASILAKQLRG